MSKQDKNNPNERITTSIKIDKELLKRVKKFAIDSEKRLFEVFEEALKEFLNKNR